ncbi:MAG: S-layer homology domain-containing protein [Eubacteriales bacterium]|nr:S-layer homology domain-containing protein [Eubacteriales bacterium]
MNGVEKMNVAKKRIATLFLVFFIAYSFGMIAAFADYQGSNEPGKQYFFEDFNVWTDSIFTAPDASLYSPSFKARMPYLYPQNSETLNPFIAWAGTSEDGFLAYKSNKGSGNNRIISQIQDNPNGRDAIVGMDVDWLNFTGSIVFSLDVRIPDQGWTTINLSHLYSNTSIVDAERHEMANFPRLKVSPEGKVTLDGKRGGSLTGYPPSWGTNATQEFPAFKPGDWIQLQAVVTRNAKDTTYNGVTYPYPIYYVSYFCNGSQIKDDETGALSTILVNPNASAKIQNNPSYIEACKDIYANNSRPGYPENYKGIGVWATVEQSSNVVEDGGGLDNLNFRVYDRTAIPETLGIEPEEGQTIVDRVSIPLLNTAFMNEDVAPLVKCGIADINYNSENPITVTAMKYNADDKFFLNGEDVSHDIRLVYNKLEERSSWSLKKGTDDVIWPDGSAIILDNLDLAPDELLVVTIDNVKDILGNELINNKVILYNNRSESIKITKYEFKGPSGELLEPTKVAEGYMLSPNVSLMRFFGNVSSSDSIALFKGNDFVGEAVYSSGIYTIDLGERVLSPNTEYTVKYNNVDYYTFTTRDGSFWISQPYKDMNGIIKYDYINSTTESLKVYTINIGYDNNGKQEQLKCNVKEIVAGSWGIIKGEFSASPNEQLYIVDSFSGKLIDTDVVRLDVTYIDNNGKFSVYGKAKNTQSVKVAVFKPGDEWKTDYTAAAADSLIFFEQIEPDDLGAYSVDFVFKEDIAFNEYAVVAYFDDKIYYVPLFYSTDAENTAALNILNSASSVDEVLEIINTKSRELSFVYSLYNKVSNKKNVAKLIYDYIAQRKKQGSAGFDVHNRAEAASIFRQYVAIQACAEGIIGNIADVSMFVPIMNTLPVSDWVSPQQNISIDRMSGWLEGVTLRLRKQNFNNVKEFNDKFIAALVFEIVANPQSQESLRKMLTDFSGPDYINLDTKLITTKTVSRLYGAEKKYTGFDYTPLKADLKAFSEENIYGGPQSTSSGGRGNVSVVVEHNPVVVEPIAQTPNVRFDDLDEVEWAVEAINSLADLNVISGKGDGKFAPNDYIKREEIVKMIVSILDLDLVEDELPYLDVSKDDWHYKYISTALKNEIIRGISDVSFGSGQNITRQDLCVVVYNALSYKNIDLEEENELSFVDANEISDYAVSSVAALISKGCLAGYEDGSFRPFANATRAEAAKILFMVLKLFQ